jgi:hypothetical protein
MAQLQLQLQAAVLATLLYVLSVYVCEREREGGRECVCVCVCVCRLTIIRICMRGQLKEQVAALSEQQQDKLLTAQHESQGAETQLKSIIAEVCVCGGV